MCPNYGQITTNLPLHMGGLGFRSAVRFHPASHWVSCANTVAMVQDDPRGEFDAPHSDVNQQCPTVPPQVGWCWF